MIDINKLYKTLKPLTVKHYSKKGEPYFDGIPLNVVINKIVMNFHKIIINNENKKSEN